MALVTHKFKLDLTPGASRQVLYTSQGDIGRPFKADLYWNGSPWTATGTTASIRGKKPDDTVFDYTATVSGTAVTFETTEQMTIISGPVECELVFTDGTDIVASANFVLMVEDSPYNPDALSESDIPTIGDLIEDTIGGDVRDEVDALITAHPELMLQDDAVTTPKLADGAVTYAKLDNSLKAYVTPEMFGAVGDGVADDTAAWQAAVNVGVPVIAKSSIYKCGQINVTKNISIDCNNAEFVCTSEYLFKPSGEVVTTLTGENDYTAGQKNYTISNSNYSNYSGFAMIRGTNNWNPLRTYYFGGMVGFFANGIFTDSMPIDVTGISIDIINPVTCDIRNINGVTFSETHDGKIIYCSYGVNCNFENIATNKECYHVVGFYRCYQCTAAGINAVLPPYTGSESSIYPIACLDTCYTTTKNSTIYNPFWHAWTTGRHYLCIGNIIDNCIMKCGNNHAIQDHENAIGTVVRNTTASQIGLGQGAVVENVKITSTNDNSGSYCELQFHACPIEDLAVYTARNIIFEPSDNAESIGVCLKTYTQTTGNTVYYKNIYLENVFYNNANAESHASNYIYYSTPVGIDAIIVKAITVNNTNIRCDFWDRNDTKIDFSNAIINYQNCKTEKPTGVERRHIVISLAGGSNTTIENCRLFWISGQKPATLTLNNVDIYGANVALSANILNGSTLKGAGFNMKGSDDILLTGVYEGQRKYSKIWRVGSTNNIYGTLVENVQEPVNVIFQTP